ncbi:hypothetical protein HZQ92_18035, partial [Elizabethkingia anophelis]|nr:hypothetical protein [Elizabethkingia anophelis]MCT3824941.1 hypothetical protein [Elizabethkingia anophelis]MCT3932246.1 hypothetical protein [Elizabethkingia anophelis]MCT4113982.1 hypothetical protein [Elizabethkingia anophelis]
MEIPKLQAIKAAYGEYWDKVKDYVNKNGWCDFKSVFGDIDNGKGLEGIELETMDNYDPKYCYWKRPKSLSGIENNRGWTRIESEKDLPKEYKNYWCRTYNGDTKILRFDPEFKEWYYECNTGLSFTVTHYQP